MSFENVIAMGKLRKRVEAGEDIFDSVSDMQLKFFMKTIAMETTDTIKDYHEVVAWMLQLNSEARKVICREYFLKKAKVQYAENFGTIFIGDLRFDELR